jgi:succinate dehydrogenase / fumarate reductase flavoprotein subunit
LREGRLLADPRTAQIVARCAAQGFHDAGRYGTRLDRQGHRGPAERRFGDQTYRRSVFADEHTGPEVRRALRERVRQLAIPVLPSVYVTRLLVDDGTVFGAYGFDLVDGSRYLVPADSVILAAGGHTRIWRRTPSRRDENTGDAFRLAVEAGARLRDPELVQFHPFGLIRPENAAGILVSEAACGEGGVLLNNLGERFMTRYDAERMELCGRDRVASASYTEIKEGRGTGQRRMARPVPPAACDGPVAAAAGAPDPVGPADARHHPRPDRGGADCPVRHGRCLGPARGHHGTDVNGSS